eukprot:CAMPEP_0169411924 /NCGR_PEP_ID=MMETSP1017-20121227/60553_1 /TAXON_ID=342587 /ORGANISM="Karlodinium micrum, Strain CCMP2283" /LENGTH=483 /DNA_ID=CAMNT_0009519247 /DNA_START=36 /DNA_END=1488 /DNA_ORIENTATION=-
MSEAQRASVRGSDEEVTAIILELEIGAMSWGADLTFSAFTATVTCDVLMRLLLEKFGTDMKEWVIFQVDWDSFFENTWAWSDVLFFVGIALVLGPFSALHTHMCLQIGAIRQRLFKRMRWQSLGKTVDGLSFAAVCAFVATLVAQLGGCKDLGDFNPEDANLELVRFTCDVGQYNPVASLLVTTSEAAMKLLITREDPDVGNYFFNVSDLLLAFAAYSLLNILLTGIPVPSGNFTGTMLIGGMFGRTVGNVVRHWYPGDDLAKPGVYAMMGSAGMLCGFKRMSMAVVLFIAECGDDWNLIPPLMITVASSLILNQCILKNGFDEEQIMRKSIPFLEPEAHEGLFGHLSIAEAHVYDIPVVSDDNICIGLTTQARIRAAWSAVISARSSVQQGSSSSMQPHAVENSDLPLARRLVEADAEDLCLEELVDRSPYKVDEDMPAHRVYQLFAKAGINLACVVSIRGEFRGVITRSHLSKVATKLHEH